MTKTIKLKAGIIAMAIVLSCNLAAWAQAGKGSAPTSATASEKLNQKNPAAAELKSFKADESNPELSNLRLSLLQAKADLETGRNNNSLNQAELERMNLKINILQTQIRKAMSANPEVFEANATPYFKNYIQTKSLTRSQFMNLTDAQQKVVMNEYTSSTITDLENVPSGLKVAQDNVFYLTTADFNGVSMEKQIHMLNNPATYVIGNTEVLPSRSVAQPASTGYKMKMSRAEFNAASPEKQKAILDSKEVLISDEIITPVSNPDNSQASPAPAAKVKMTRAEYNAASPERKKAIDAASHIVITD